MLEDPLSFSLKLSVTWIETAAKFDLETLWDVFLHDLLVLDSAENLVELFSHEHILDLLGDFCRILDVVSVGCLSSDFLLEDLLFGLFLDFSRVYLHVFLHCNWR